MLSRLFDRLMFYVFDDLLDDLWANNIEFSNRGQLVATVGHVGFGLAFVRKDPRDFKPQRRWL